MNSVYNLGGLFVIQQSSAAWLNVASTISLPLINIMFSLPDAASLLLVVAGVALYNRCDGREGAAVADGGCKGLSAAAESTPCWPRPRSQSGVTPLRE